MVVIVVIFIKEDEMKLIRKQQNIFSKFTGIWRDRDITQESIRKKAWRAKGVNYDSKNAK